MLAGPYGCDPETYLPKLGAMVFRKKGTLLELERQILEVAVARGAGGIYGFSLAQELAGERGETKLISHGTMYKALDRLRREGLLSAEWEDHEIAEAAGRPRRRIYHVTGAGVRALASVDASEAGGLQLGEAGA